MLRSFSNRLRDDAHRKVQHALRTNGIVNIVQVSEEIRLENLTDNIAREDIESLVMEISQLYGAPIEFDDNTLTALDMPDVLGSDNRNDLEKALRDRSATEASVDMLHLDE